MPDAVLDGDGQRDRVTHRPDTGGHRARLGHQAGAERAALHALARAAAIEVDLVVAPLLGEPGRARQVVRLAAAELQRDRMLLGIEVEVTRNVAVHQRAGGHHLGVEARVAREQAVEVPAVAVGPVHHGAVHRRHG
jgi:hypothetical protein